MAINLGLNVKTNTKTNHTVSVVASSGITLSTVNSSTKRLTGSANENVSKEICTITFTAKENFYYSQEPSFSFSFLNGKLTTTSTVTKNALNRVTKKVFVISAESNVNTIYNNISFNEEISVSQVPGINNTTLKQINSISFDTASSPPSGEIKSLKVLGTENSSFKTTVTRSSDSKTYDFESKTFTTSSTSISETIPSSGEKSIDIVIPSSVSSESYNVNVSASANTLTVLPSSITSSFDFSQLKNTTVTFNCVSANSAYTGTHGALPSSSVLTGLSGQSLDAQQIIELQPKLNTKAFKAIRTNNEVKTTDFQIITTQAMSGSTTDTSITLTSSNAQIVPGMVVTGTGITNEGVTVETISGTDLVLSGSPGGTVSGTLTFTGSGFDLIQKSTGLVFTTQSLTNTDNVADLVINDVSKTANADSTGTAITLANAESDAVGTVVGVYVGTSSVADGANAEGLTVTSVDSSQNTVVVNASRTIRSGQTITFTGAGRVAEISFIVNVVQFPTVNTTISINLDNLLQIDPNWS